MQISSGMNDFATWSRIDRSQLKTLFLSGKDIGELSSIYQRHSNKIYEELNRQGLIENFVNPHIRFENQMTRPVTRKTKETFYYESIDESSDESSDESDYVPSDSIDSDTEDFVKPSPSRPTQPTYNVSESYMSEYTTSEDSDSEYFPSDMSDSSSEVSDDTELSDDTEVLENIVSTTPDLYDLKYQFDLIHKILSRLLSIFERFFD